MKRSTLFGIALVFLSSCGGAWDGADTGSVSVALTDVPLSQLQTLTIDLSGAVLKGAGVPDAVLFPPAGSAGASLTVDLLWLQGINQFLANANIAVGTYYAIELEYSNPQATSVGGVAQTVNHASTTIVGLFAPSLVVMANSTQSIQVDFDLRHSVVDLGPTGLFLAPAVLVRVVGIDIDIPLGRVVAGPVSVDVASDSFEAAVRFSGGYGPHGGQVTVQCDAQTTFTDAAGNTTTGNVTAQLQVGDRVAIDGSLLNGVIDADAVTVLLSAGSGAPAPIELAGTILQVDTGAGSVTVRVQDAFGPDPTLLPARFRDVVVNVGAAVPVHRGHMPLTLADLQPGNFCRALVDAVTSDTFDGRSLDEHPSSVTGTLVSVTQGGLANGQDLVTFAPLAVNQIPVGQLPFFAWQQLTVDVPSGFPGQAGDPFGVCAFFDGTSHLVYHAFRGHTGPNPPPPPPGHHPRAVLGGTVSGQATVNAQGEIEFDLAVAGGPNAPVIGVVVDPQAHISLHGPNTAPLALSVQDAVTALHQSPPFVAVEGAAAPNGAVFLADVALRIFTAAPTGGGPGGPGHHDVLVGRVSGVASMGANGEILFTLDLSGGPQPGPAVLVDVTVDPGALLELFTHQAGGGHHVVPTVLTPALAIQELNQQPLVQVVGQANPTAGTFSATVALRIFR